MLRIKRFRNLEINKLGLIGMNGHNILSYNISVLNVFPHFLISRTNLNKRRLI